MAPKPGGHRGGGGSPVSASPLRPDREPWASPAPQGPQNQPPELGQGAAPGAPGGSTREGGLQVSVPRSTFMPPGGTPTPISKMAKR